MRNVPITRAEAKRWNTIRLEQCKGKIAATARIVGHASDTVRQVLIRFGMYSGRL